MNRPGSPAAWAGFVARGGVRRSAYLPGHSFQAMW